MKLLLFTTFNCKACGAHQKEVVAFAEKNDITLKIYNVDDPNYFHQVLQAMKKHGLKTNPSIVVQDDEGETIQLISGIKHSIETLNTIINETGH